MFSQTWKIYLPVIVILLKRSAQEEQYLNMNQTDFERAAGGRKMKYSFHSLHLNNAKLEINNKHTAVAKELVILLQEDESSRDIIKEQNFEFTLNNDFKLTIRNTTPVSEEIEETVSEGSSDSEEAE